MTPLARTLFLAEVTICFAPATFLLAIGAMILSPIYLVMLLVIAVDGVPPNDPEGVGDMFRFLIVISLGATGFIALVSSVRAVLAGTSVPLPWMARIGCISGVAAILTAFGPLSLLSIELSSGEGKSWSLCLYDASLVWLPLAGSVHVSYLAKLFHLSSPNKKATKNSH